MGGGVGSSSAACSRVGEGVVKGQWTVGSGLTLSALGLVCISSSAQGRFCAGGWDTVVLSARTLDVA